MVSSCRQFPRFGPATAREPFVFHASVWTDGPSRLRRRNLSESVRAFNAGSGPRERPARGIGSAPMGSLLGVAALIAVIAVGMRLLRRRAVERAQPGRSADRAIPIRDYGEMDIAVQ